MSNSADLIRKMAHSDAATVQQLIDELQASIAQSEFAIEESLHHIAEAGKLIAQLKSAVADSQKP